MSKDSIKDVIRSEDWILATLRSIGDAVITTDSDGNVSFMNPVAETLTGWKLVDASDQPLEKIFNIINEQTRQPAENPVTRVFREGNVIGLGNHTILISRDGREIPIDDSGAPIKDDTGNITGVVLVFRDITERKRVEKKLEEHSERLEEMIEDRTEELQKSRKELAIKNRISNLFLTVPDENIYMDVLKVLLEISQSKFGVIGYIDEEGAYVVPSMTRHVWDKCKVPDKRFVFPRDTWGDSIWPRAIRERRLLYSNEISARAPEGHIPITRNVTPVIISHGEVIGCMQVANKESDYTEEDLRLLETISNHIAPILDARLKRERQEKARKRAQEALRESEEKYRFITENANDLISVLNERFEVDFVNVETHNRILGAAAQEGKVSDIDQIHPDDLQKVLTSIKTCFETGEPIITTYRLKHVDGHFIWFEALTRIIVDEDGNKKLISTARDITERRQAEEALLKSERQASAAIEAARAFTFNYNIATGKISWGGSVEEITGYTPEEFAKVDIEGWAARIHPDDRDEILSILQEAMGKERATAEYRFKTKKGYITLASTSLTVKEEGKPVRLYGILQDITERKRAEEALRDAQEELARKEKLAAVGKLASSIGHELRNPLGVIGNSTYYLNMKLKEPGEKVKKHLDILQREVQRSNKIISDLLDFARIKSLSLAEMDVNRIIKDSLSVIELPKKVVVKNHLESGVARIPLDPNQMQQVFQNIISNAVQAMPDGGKLEIQTSTKDDWVEIAFKDTGVGIPKENLKKIFEPLFSTRAKGIGLGLSIVRDIIKKHEGKIEVESEVGVGTTFTIKLPKKGGREGE